MAYGIRNRGGVAALLFLTLGLVLPESFRLIPY
jgi:hypothetical protein